MIQDCIILTRHFSFLVAPFEVLRYAVSLDLNEGIVVEEVISLDITFQALVQLLQILHENKDWGDHYLSIGHVNPGYFAYFWIFNFLAGFQNFRALAP